MMVDMPTFKFKINLGLFLFPVYPSQIFLLYHLFPYHPDPF